MARDRTEAQIVYERIEELRADGLSNAEAIRKVAAERGKKENAVRANQHQYRQKLGKPAGGSRQRAKAAELSVDDAVAQARAVLEKALAGIDVEVESAKQALDDAQARYDAIAESVKQRKADLEKKIRALA